MVQRLQELVDIAATARGRRGTTPPAARELLAQARANLEEVELLESANERYATAHLAALRTAAAVLAVRGRPEERPGRRKRIRSAWEVLPEIAPELTEWSLLFAAGARNRARAEAGIQGAVSFADADEMNWAAGMFLRIVERTVLSQGPRHSHPFGTDPGASTRQANDEAAEPGASPSEEADSARFGDLPVGHTPPGPPLGDDDDEWDE
ncbi:SAV_6107 family HEPN domain-containing protein [Streptomyces sp. NPDC003720]|uniref:SAV_6107 family HEPN domain-containing protein n=1 Tax=Streptomyces sp. NPDC003720 TaxID=3364684 RepID=UPI00369F70D0